MEVDNVRLDLFTRLFFHFHRGIMDVHAADFALAQIDTAFGIQRKCIGLDSGQRQLLRSSNCEALRQHRGDGKVITKDGDVARLSLAQQAVNDFLGVKHSRECDFHQLHILFDGDGSGRINLRGFLRQIALLCQDSQVDAVILETQVCNSLRMRIQINVCRVFDNIAQHSGNLLGSFRPRNLLCKGKHLASRFPLSVCRFCKARKANVGENGDRQDHRNDSSE